MFRFDDLFKKKKKTRDLKDISLNEVSYVDSPANQCTFLIVKSENGVQLNDLDELLCCEAFSDEQAEQVDLIMKQLDFLDDTPASAIGDLILAVTSQPAIAKSCEAVWPSITRQVDSVIKIPCLVKKSELNSVDVFLQHYVSKAKMDEDEIAVISKSLEVISDLDDESLGAVYSLLKIEFSEQTVTKRWPSLFRHVEGSDDMSDIDVEAQQRPVKKSGLMWPTISGQL